MAESRSPRLLPPIPCRQASSSGNLSPACYKALTAEKSKFHGNCHTRSSIYMDWSAKPDKKHAERFLKPEKSLSLASIRDTEEQEVINFLNKHPDFMDAYVGECVPLEVVEKWVQKKSRKIYGPSTSGMNRQPVRCRPKATIPKKQAFVNLLGVLQNDHNEHSVMWEMAKTITKSIGVDAFRVYKLFPDHPTFVQYFVMDARSPNQSSASKNLSRADVNHVGVVLDVAKRGTCLRLSRYDEPVRFPPSSQNLLRVFGIKFVKEANYVMYQPILNKAAKVTYVIEMWRVKEKFREVDEEISSNFLVWGSLSLHYCNLFLDKKRETSMADFLLVVVKAIFEEMISLEQLIKTILEFAQKLVNADRASLFLVDYRNYELVSTVFDLKYESGQDRDMEKKEIRMPISRGIAGFVAQSGETMNIPDAYSDYRFNREVDEATGYKTVSILCMPIKVEGRVIGVVQMVNKRNDDNFDHEDEASFETFATFFGLALHHARLYDRIIKKEQKYRVALEVLSYHNTCRENEVQTLLSDRDLMNVDLNDFYLDPFSLNEFEKCKSVISMFNDLFDLSKFSMLTVTRFVLTVKKNYRTVPYHNFDHGWSVAHAMYVILKNDSRKRFDYKMRLALFVASLCHDLDHRGYTNKYMSETASPLAAMYTTSTLEHHHFNITVTILQQDGHNIFSHFSSEDYKVILGLIRQCILATDLAAFFPNLDKMSELYDDNTPTRFNWSINSHRDLAMAISMTAADLSASAKPWKIQIKTVKVIFEEFYDQGDKERQAGRVPIPMMDRNKPEEQPASQVGFLSQICIPCYSMLFKIIPNTKLMYVMALRNLERWQTRAERIEQRLERPGDDDAGDDDDIDSVSDDEEDIGIFMISRNLETDEEYPSDDVEEDEEEPESSLANPCSLSWEEDEVFEPKYDANIWQDIDGVTWNDDEGVDPANRALKNIINPDNNTNE